MQLSFYLMLLMALEILKITEEVDGNVEEECEVIFLSRVCCRRKASVSELKL